MRDAIGSALVVLLVAVSTSGCGSDEPKTFCGKLAAQGQGCGSTTESTCENVIAQEKRSTPKCTSQLDTLVACIEGLRLSCSGTSSIAANGDGIFKGSNFIGIGGASVVINDSKCDAVKRTYETCRSSP
jgi:hypothetical protein